MFMATFNELLEMVTSINVMIFMTQVLTIRVRWRVFYGRQELFTLCYHLGSHSMFGGVCVDHSLSRRCFVVSLCFVCSVPSVASVFRLSILCCPFGFLQRLFKLIYVLLVASNLCLTLIQIFRFGAYCLIGRQLQSVKKMTFSISVLNKGKTDVIIFPLVRFRRNFSELIMPVIIFIPILKYKLTIRHFYAKLL